MVDGGKKMKTLAMDDMKNSVYIRKRKKKVKKENPLRYPIIRFDVVTRSLLSVLNVDAMAPIQPDYAKKTSSAGRPSETRTTACNYSR